MADLLTIMNATVQNFSAFVTAGVFAASDDLARYILRLFFAVASN